MLPLPSYLPVSRTLCKTWHYLLSQWFHLSSLFCTIASYLPWHTFCSCQIPLSCPKTFCLCFVPCLFLWSLFPILFPCLVMCSPNDVPDISSCKAVSSSPCIPSEADFLLCIRASPVFPPQRGLYTSSLFPSCPFSRICVATIFLSEGFLFSCLYQSVCISTASFSHLYCLGAALPEGQAEKGQD